MSEWERGLERLLARIPGMEDVLVPGEHRIFGLALEEGQRILGELVPRLFDTLHLVVNLVAVLVMAIYFALRPDIYRDLVIALTPPRFRDAATEVIVAVNETLRAWTIAQLLAMTTLAALTALGLWLLDVPYWLSFSMNLISATDGPCRSCSARNAVTTSHLSHAQSSASSGHCRAR